MLLPAHALPNILPTQTKVAQIAAEPAKRDLILSHSTIFLPSNLREFCGPFGFVPASEYTSNYTSVGTYLGQAKLFVYQGKGHNLLYDLQLTLFIARVVN